MLSMADFQVYNCVHALHQMFVGLLSSGFLVSWQQGLYFIYNQYVPGTFEIFTKKIPDPFVKDTVMARFMF